jgi:hypothetical protein
LNRTREITWPYTERIGICISRWSYRVGLASMLNYISWIEQAKNPCDSQSSSRNAQYSDQTSPPGPTKLKITPRERREFKDRRLLSFKVRSFWTDDPTLVRHIDGAGVRFRGELLRQLLSLTG